MKQVLFGSLSAVAMAIAAAATPTIAAELTTSNGANSRLVRQTPPVTLVNLAQQGHFRNRGIPSSQALTQAIAAGQVTPESLVQAGIQNNLVNSDTLNNQSYLNVIEVQFREIVQDFVISSSDISDE
ncbi:hypothetical protein H6F68_22340 [Trichocoleus sp. FACHB-262]|nr:hypothetical protein [Trichocoleus sp. FACHB-262]